MQLRSLLLTSFLGFSSIEAKIIKFDSDTLIDGIQEGAWFIKFYAPWCSASKRFQPIWESLDDVITKNQTTTIKLGEFDCQTYSNLCDTIKINRYPTLLLFDQGNRVDENSDDATRDALLKYANTKFPKQT